ncbi:hypothetical protein CA51_31440 [Rosistilla oblonga]|nr:hypothetical protein CA51_31440 [Rosistilla oblonga]
MQAFAPMGESSRRHRPATAPPLLFWNQQFAYRMSGRELNDRFPTNPPNCASLRHVGLSLTDTIAERKVLVKWSVGDD